MFKLCVFLAVVVAAQASGYGVSQVHQYQPVIVKGYSQGGYGGHGGVVVAQSAHPEVYGGYGGHGGVVVAQTVQPQVYGGHRYPVKGVQYVSQQVPTYAVAAPSHGYYGHSYPVKGSVYSGYQAPSYGVGYDSYGHNYGLVDANTYYGPHGYGLYNPKLHDVLEQRYYQG